MNQPPFPTFDALFRADAHELAAVALDLFRAAPKFRQHQLAQWLRSMVTEKGQTLLGMPISEPPPLEATEHKILLIWEHALVASRTVEGSDHSYLMVLLLDPAVLALSVPDRIARLRGQQTLR